MFDRVAHSLGHSPDEVPTSEIELTDLAAINWDDLPFCLALSHIAALSHHKESVTRVIDGLRFLSQILEFQHIRSIRVSPDEWREVEVKLVFEPGLNPEMAMQVASTFVETSDIDGQRNTGLTVDSNG